MVVAYKFEQGTVELIRPGLQAGIDNGAHRVPILGRRVSGDELEFLNRVDIGRVADAVILRFVRIHAVETEVVRLRPVAVDQRPAASRSREACDVVSDYSRS